MEDASINSAPRDLRIICEFTELPNEVILDDANSTKLSTELRKYLPAFALFKLDRTSTDQDPEAQNPLKATVKEAIRAKEVELTAITEYVRSEVQKPPYIINIINIVYNS